MIDQKIFKNLNCPECHADLSYASDKLVCSGCGKLYLVKGNIPCLIENQGKGFIEKSSDVLINRTKVFFKQCPVLFDILHNIFGASRIGLSAEKAIKDLKEDKLILNLGSGTKIKRADVVNVDFYPFANVNVVADITKLPFKDNSVDAVICESVLEHMKDPWSALKEMHRVLKLGGLAYVTVPFMAGFHSSPEDYYRWSREGLKVLMQEQGFKEIKSGVRHGSTSAVLSIVNDWLATLVSFNSGKLKQVSLIFLTIITAPLKVLDYFISKFKTSENIAFGFYYLGRKEK